MPMACLDMYNSNEHKGLCAPMSPRISFSNDFVESQHLIKHDRSSREAHPPSSVSSSDFEFSVSNYSMMSADELFFKGRLLPFKDNCTTHLHKTTLREELLVVDEEEEEQEEEEEVSPRPSKGSSTRWKGLLGLKRTHIGSKKSDKTDHGQAAAVEGKRSIFGHEETHVGKTTTSTQETMNGGGSSRRDVEYFRII